MLLHRRAAAADAVAAAPGRPGRAPAARAPLARPPAALPPWLAKIVDFESWAPRSSRMWRLDQYSYERSTSSSDEEIEREQAIEGLQARVEALRRAESRRGGGAAPAADDEEEGDDNAPPSTSGAAAAAEEGKRGLGAEDSTPLTAAAIARAAEEANQGAAADAAEDAEPPLSSDEIRLLLLQKWGRQYDMAFVRRDLPGMRPFIALNVFCNCLEQRSFILTEEQYVQKLDAIALRLQVLGQTARVRSFLQAPAKSQKGLPRRPTMGTAVSISLDVTPAQVEAYFTGQF